MDAYVFIRQATQGTIGLLMDLYETTTEIRAVASTTGPYDALVFLDVSGQGELEAVVQKVIRNEAGATWTETAVAIAMPEHDAANPGPYGPKRWFAMNVESFSRIRARPGRALDVMNSVRGLDAFLGAAVVAADFDVLLELGAGDVSKLNESLLQIGSVDGVLWSDTAYATLLAGPRSET